MLDPRVVDIARCGGAPRLEKQMDEVSHAVGTVVAKVGASQIRGTPGAIQEMRPLTVGGGAGGVARLP